ncbi:MAG: DUF192 domain-containing protein [Deltaproteobacteria bacterium]|nr:DUF192 domain-containing protein [Deltaproteobacteria bacterium]
MWGLIPRSRLEAGEGLLLPRTSSITMIFMRMRIDAVAVDADGVAVRCWQRLRPWSIAHFAPGARDVVELPAGTIAATGTVVGDKLLFATA